MTHINKIDIEFDQDALATLITVFEQMIEESEDIDFSMMDLSPWDDFLKLVVKLKKYQASRENPVIVPMSFNEWFTYSPYVQHSFDIVLNDDEIEVMYRLDEFNLNLFADGLTPTGP